MAKRKRDAEAVAEALDAGLVTHKQVRRRRESAEAAKSRGSKEDWREDGGAFKNGVLHVKPQRPALPRDPHAASHAAKKGRHMQKGKRGRGRHKGH